ncbi:hypothetical protein TL18_02730 [Methanobrevibacter sp. YE315]|uniref:DUF1284 domain-containing protein n=1 Tax=Methanobrevibacter sp. YE315 TaxID=1609968 RepID=UPI000764E98F|nr:DUF1284 domain-containing protein [Methanobrevibacter sp. YE315]AMD17032.1 hypothetical protein TL18_02730 [Methanobrevibacter sp. YE315]
MKLFLRGHHLLCLKGFQGYGYDENFTENMIEVNEKRKLPQTNVYLTNAPDDICKACPNLKNNICGDELQNERIINMDNEVLNKLDISKEHNSVDLFEKIDNIFNTKESVSKICFECMWHDKCLFYQKLSNNR